MDEFSDTAPLPGCDVMEKLTDVSSPERDSVPDFGSSSRTVRLPLLAFGAVLPMLMEKDSCPVASLSAETLTMTVQELFVS